MRTSTKLLLSALALAGAAVAVQQRRQAAQPQALRAEEPFMRATSAPDLAPAADREAAAPEGSDATGGGAKAEGVDDDADTAELPTVPTAGAVDVGADDAGEPAEVAEVAAEAGEADAGEGGDGTAADGEGGGVHPLPGPPHGPFATAPEGPADDLKRISGVGPKLERMLNDEGITTFAQVASLDDAQVDALQARLPQFPGRIRRDEWVDQARRLLDQG